MFFISKAELDRRLKQMRIELDRKGISDELRGWFWHTPPVEPPSREVLLGVSEVASRYCSTFRDIYLRRIAGIQPPASFKMIRGIIFHKVSSEAVTIVKKTLFKLGLVNGYEILQEAISLSNKIVKDAINQTTSRFESLGNINLEKMEKEARSLYNFLVIQAAAQIDRIISKFPHIDLDSLVSLAIPPIVERKVDGSLIGLSRELSVDIYAPAYAVADLKTGSLREFHPYAPTGYALAIESEEEVAVNYGIIIYVRLDDGKVRLRLKHFLIGDELRRQFLDIRDEAFEIVMNGVDPGKPDRCPLYCPYYEVCRSI